MVRVSSGLVPASGKLVPDQYTPTHIHIPLYPLPKPLPKLLNESGALGEQSLQVLKTYLGRWVFWERTGLWK